MDKPGYLTTEFWLAVVAQIVPILVTIGVLTAGQGQTLASSAGNLLAAAVVFAAAVWPVVEYVKSRAKVKEAALLARKTSK